MRNPPREKVSRDSKKDSIDKIISLRWKKINCVFFLFVLRKSFRQNLIFKPYLSLIR